jgi:ribosomal protein S18 acetylase RimI-like enzyme
MTPAQVEEACALLAESGVSVLEFLTLQTKLSSGEWRAVVQRSHGGAAVVVLSEREDWRQVLLTHGAAPALHAAIKELRSSSEAMIWDEGVVKLEPATLDELGFRLLERQTFTQELSRVPLDHPEPPELEVQVLTKADHAAARLVFAATHAMNIEGLYTTWPHPPTLERCAMAFDDYLAGVLGEVVPTACVVTKLEGKVVGVICCAKTDQADTGVLLGLGVDPAGRGKGLSRILVRRAQRALKAAGFARMLFLTTDRNTPVHRLFTAEEIISTETSPARLWLRSLPGAPAPERPAKPG